MGLINLQTFTIKRQTTTSTAAGGSSKAWTTAARGSLPTTWQATEVPLRPDERYEYLMRDIKIEGELYGTDNPQVDERDLLVNSDGETLRVVETLKPDKSGTSRLSYYIVGFERFTGGPK